MGLKTSTVSLFSQQHHPYANEEAKDGKKTASRCTHSQISLIMQADRQTDGSTDRINMHPYTQTGAETRRTKRTARHELRHAHTGAEIQTLIHRQTDSTSAAFIDMMKRTKHNKTEPIYEKKSTLAPASWLQLWRHQIQPPFTQWPLQLV